MMTATAQPDLFDPTATAATDPTALPAPAPPQGWPAPPDDAVFTGLAGEIVASLAPHTEADPVAILVSLLVGFGSLVGPEPHYRVGPSAHRANEYTVLVGPSGAGRKGSSWDAVEAILARVDPHWADQRIVSGLSSGEGLIWHLRDRDERIAPDRRLLVLKSLV
jgi:hypothetical protein